MQDMTKNIFSSRTVAFLATVVLFLGGGGAPATAKTAKKAQTSKTTQMATPDFAYPKTVEKDASAALDIAIAKGDWASAVESTIQIVTANNIVSRNNAAEGLAKIDSVAAIAPELWKAPFLLIKADLYSSIYGNVIWKADQRKLPLDSVPNDPYEWSRDIFADKVYNLCSEILNSASDYSFPLKEWGKMLENADDAYTLGMTAEEFIFSRSFSLLGDFADETQDVIPFFTTASTPVTPAQKCADLRGKAIDRLISLASESKQSLLLARALSDKADTLPYSLRMKSLLDAYDMVKGQEGEQPILSDLRDYVSESQQSGDATIFPYTTKEYIALLQKSIEEYPKGRYVNNLKNIINELTRPFSEIQYKGQYLSSSVITIDAKLTNCNQSWALVYDYSPFANSTNNQPKNKEIASRCKLVKAVKLSAEGSIPFSAEIKAEIGRLPKGSYVVIPSATADGKGIYSNILNDSWREPFTVSDISVMTLQQPNAETRVFVINGSNGAPIEGAQVKVFTRKNYSSPRILSKTLTTDKDGSVTVTEERFEIEATYDGSKWSNESRYNNYTSRRDTTERKRTQILTDRALFHPGDSVKAAVIAYSARESAMYLNEGLSLEMVLRDTNGQEVATQSVTTDHFGRATAEFKLPTQGLLGSWQVLARDADKRWLGSAMIQVADYVAPTFFITSEHTEEDVIPGDTVVMKGQVMTYSGMPVGGASVHFNVNYTPPMRWFASGYATFDSSVEADEEGRYEIKLPTANLKGTQFERGVFSVQLSATSPAGETQNGPTERFALGKEYSIFSPDGGMKMNITDSIAPITFYVNDIFGKRVKKEVAYEMIDNATKETVAAGTFTSPILNLPNKKYPSARYTIKVALKDDADVKNDVLLTLWRSTDKAAPEGTDLWVPNTEIVAHPDKATVDITVGSGVADRWIPYVLSGSDGQVIAMEWIHVDKDNVTLPLKAPKGDEKYNLNLNWMSDLETEKMPIIILPASAEETLKVETESFRDKVTAGDAERWSFRFSRKSSNASDIPALAVMTDAALNAITPFNWNFTPQPNSYPTFTSMRMAGNSTRNLNTSLRNIRYLSFNTLSLPYINTYNESWGLGGRMYYDGGVAYVTGSIKNEMKVMRSATSMKLAAPMMNAMATADSADMVVEEVAEAESEDAAPAEGMMVRGMGNAGASTSQEAPELRETEFPVAFFLPNLVTDKDGVVNIDFTVPNFNTTWAFQMIGYDQQLQSAKTSLQTVASKPIMVTTHAPRFVRTGDSIELTATVFNNSDAKCAPKCRFELVDLISGKTIEAREFASEAIEVAASRILSMHWDVPSDVSAVGFRAYAEASSHRDGEQALVPVLPASSPVVESTPFWIAPGGNKLEVKLPKFKPTDQVTLQYCDNPAWYCITALPDIVTPDSKSVTSKIKALFGNAIAFNLISTRPNLKQGLETLLSDKDSEFAALKSNLEKDGNLKITQLSNTPWVNNAESETLRMSRLGSLLDDVSAKKSIDEILDDVRSLQTSEGGWSWCPEMEASSWITRDVLRHFAMIVKAGAAGTLSDSESMIRKGIKYVDSETLKDYKKYHKKGESLSYLLDWLYVRSSFPTSFIPSGSTSNEMSSLATKARKDIAAEWKDWGIGQKAKAAVVLWRGSDHRTASEILESLRQFASVSPEKGMWFDNLNSGWGGMSTLQTTTLVLEAFAEIQPSNTVIDSLRQWLVLGRQYQDWGKNTYTVETVNAILSSGSEWNDADASQTPEFQLKGKKIVVPESAKLTGAFTLTLNPKDASGKTLTISRSSSSAAWGGVISQYEAPIMEVVPAEVPELSIRKSIVALVVGDDGQLIPKEGIELKKGMKVRVTLFINAGRDMDYVAVTDERSACLEPIEQLSGYTASDRVGFYREVRDASTNLFFGWLPKGQHVVSYDCTVSQDGEFSCGIATAQSQYSPLTVAHSAGAILKVK